MTKPIKQEFHIQIKSENRTAVDWLAEASDLSRQKLKQYMQKGCVWLERVKNEISDVSEIDPLIEPIKAERQGYVQRLRRAKKILNQGDILHFYYDESVLANEPTPAILIEDLGGYSIWNKPSGMLSQGSKWGDHSTIYRWAEKQLQPERPAFIVHRLDRAATGLIILAHKKSVASQFSKMFEERKIDKHYRVVVKGDFSKMISDSENNEGVLTVDDNLDDKIAISHVHVIDYDAVKNVSTLDVKIETGRKHQIRKHLSNLGFPVVGDRLYGNVNETAVEGEAAAGEIEAEKLDLQLQAKSLKFICPLTSEEKIFTLGW